MRRLSYNQRVRAIMDIYGVENEKDLRRLFADDFKIGMVVRLYGWSEDNMVYVGQEDGRYYFTTGKDGDEDEVAAFDAEDFDKAIIAVWHTTIPLVAEY